jgi:hypothetical protein
VGPKRASAHGGDEELSVSPNCGPFWRVRRR